MSADRPLQSNYWQFALPLVSQAVCARCGKNFDEPVKRPRGRPQRFCSDECRRETAKRQRREWAQRQGGKNGKAG
jgi:hypothetical protein